MSVEIEQPEQRDEHRQREVPFVAQQQQPAVTQRIEQQHLYQAEGARREPEKQDHLRREDQVGDGQEAVGGVFHARG